jgi:Tfp pilus assembly protein PilF
VNEEAGIYDEMTEEKIEGKTAEEWFDLARKAKEPKKEIKYYTKGLELDPKNADAWNNKGTALCIHLERYEEAIEC